MITRRNKLRREARRAAVDDLFRGLRDANTAAARALVVSTMPVCSGPIRKAPGACIACGRPGQRCDATDRVTAEDDTDE